VGGIKVGTIVVVNHQGMAGTTRICQATRTTRASSKESKRSNPNKEEESFWATCRTKSLAYVTMFEQRPRASLTRIDKLAFPTPEREKRATDLLPKIITNYSQSLSCVRVTSCC
jgi:hypothetical protein